MGTGMRASINNTKQIRKGSDHDTHAMQCKMQDIAGIIQMILPNYNFYEVIDISKDSQ